MATAQMNIRLDAALKREGDVALAEAGFTPTEAVRAMWEFARRNRRNPQAIRECLGQVEEGPSPEELAERQRKIDSMHAMQKMITDFYEQRGITPSMDFWNRPDDELLEEALVERMQERGLW